MNIGRNHSGEGGTRHPKYDLSELATRLDNLVKVGRIAAIDYNAGKARVQFGEGDDTMTSGWLPWASLRAGPNRHWIAPELKEQVAVFAPSGNLEGGFIVPAIACGEFPLAANGPEYEVFRYAEPGSSSLDGYYEYNRSTGVRRWWLKPDGGTFRWEVGDNTSIIVTDGQIQLRVGTNQIVVDSSSIRLLIAGRTVELSLSILGIMGTVLRVFSFMLSPSTGFQSGGIAPADLPPDVIEPEVVPPPDPPTQNKPSTPKT